MDISVFAQLLQHQFPPVTELQAAVQQMRHTAEQDDAPSAVGPTPGFEGAEGFGQFLSLKQGPTKKTLN